MVPSKPCKHCGSDKHWPFQCFKSPKRQAVAHIPAVGNANLRWQITKRRWRREHSADWYSCYICEVAIPRKELTLDHVKPRGSHPQLRYDPSNLQPCCLRCQSGKGSQSLKHYIQGRLTGGHHVSEWAKKLAERIT